MLNENIISLGKRVLLNESIALKETADRLGESFEKAVEILIETKGKVVICGMGKSGLIARKMVATFNSIGLQSVFLHPTEGLHGDIGIYLRKDTTILISKSGSTDEILKLIPILRQMQSKIISIVGNKLSPIAIHSDVVIDAFVEKEADPLGFIPTASTIVSMAIGDALASAVVKIRGISAQDFAFFHPAGQLGRNLLLTANDVMHRISQIACVYEKDLLKDVVIKMTENPLGGAVVIDKDMNLIGLITDGDVRRALQYFDFIGNVSAESIMNKNPITIEKTTSLGNVLRIMEDRSKQILVLPVVEKSENSENLKCLGLIRLHDIHQANIN